MITGLDKFLQEEATMLKAAKIIIISLIVLLLVIAILRIFR